MINSSSYVLGAQHDNQLDTEVWHDANGNVVNQNDPGAILFSGGLPCDGTVTVYSTDAVSYAEVIYTINNVNYSQKIMNVPFQDTTRTPLYIQYFLNDQDKQLNS